MCVVAERITRTTLEYASRFPHLRTSDLLNGIAPDRANAFVNDSIIKRYNLPTPVLTQGERPDAVYLIAKGVVEVTYVSPEGHRAIIGLFRPGMTIGLFEYIAGRTCAGTCKAMPGAELLAVPDDQLDQFLGDRTFIRNLAAIACNTLQHDNTYKAVDQFYTAEQRICQYLRKFAGSTGTFCENQSYLANVVGCTRQTVNKELGHLRAKGVIDIENGTIRILIPDALDQRIRELDDRSGHGLKRRG